MRSWIAGALVSVAFLAAPAQASSPLEAANPTWSPDGAQIAFAYVGESRQWLEVMRATDGGGKHPAYVSRDGCCEPVLWAAGDRIAFIDNFEVSSVAATGGKPAKLFGSTPWFILSPNGQTIALDDGCGCGHSPDSVALVGVRGGKVLVVPRPKNTSDSIDGFSPDGTQLVFTRGPWNYNGNPKGKPMVIVESVHGGTPVPLARSGLIGAAYLPAGAVAPQWSPDGKWIAFVVPGAKPNLDIVSTRGGTPTVLVSSFDGSSFSWSPRSTRIAFGARAALGRLVTVDLQGTQVVVSGSVNWVSDDSWDRPQWSPDGTKLVFMGLVGPNVPGRPPAGIWVVDADGTGLKRLA